MTSHLATGLAAVALCMLAELVVSRRHERALLQRGAVEPPGDVYRWMRVAYPAGFVAMGIEAWYRGAPSTTWIAAGAALFVASKALKYAAMAALGDRWSFRVLVLPGAPLVRSGPYRWIDHPNYVAVMGEFLGAACYMGAPMAGVLASVGFGWLIARRLRVERAALRAATGAP